MNNQECTMPLGFANPSPEKIAPTRDKESYTINITSAGVEHQQKLPDCPEEDDNNAPFSSETDTGRSLERVQSLDDIYAVPSDRNLASPQISSSYPFASDPTTIGSNRDWQRTLLGEINSLTSDSELQELFRASVPVDNNEKQQKSEFETDHVENDLYGVLPQLAKHESMELRLLQETRQREELEQQVKLLQSKLTELQFRLTDTEEECEMAQIALAEEQAKSERGRDIQKQAERYQFSVCAVCFGEIDREEGTEAGQATLNDIMNAVAPVEGTAVAEEERYLATQIPASVKNTGTLSSSDGMSSPHRVIRSSSPSKVRGIRTPSEDETPFLVTAATPPQARAWYLSSGENSSADDGWRESSFSLDSLSEFTVSPKGSSPTSRAVEKSRLSLMQTPRRDTQHRVADIAFTNRASLQNVIDPDNAFAQNLETDKAVRGESNRADTNRNEIRQAKADVLGRTDAHPVLRHSIELQEPPTTLTPNVSELSSPYQRLSSRDVYIEERVKKLEMDLWREHQALTVSTSISTAPISQALQLSPRLSPPSRYGSFSSHMEGTTPGMADLTAPSTPLPQRSASFANHAQRQSISIRRNTPQLDISTSPTKYFQRLRELPYLRTPERKAAKAAPSFYLAGTGHSLLDALDYEVRRDVLRKYLQLQQLQEQQQDEQPSDGRREETRINTSEGDVRHIAVPAKLFQLNEA